MKRTLLFVSFFLFVFSGVAQNKRILDSLNIAYQTAKNDTTKIIVINTIATQYVGVNLDTMATLAKEALSLSEKINYKRGISQATYTLGSYHFSKVNYLLSLEYYEKALKGFEDLKDKKLQGSTLNNIGLIYKYLGNYLLSLQYYQKSLAISEELKEKKTMATRMNNIGSVYNVLNNDSLAIMYYAKGLVISEELKDKRSITGSLNNIGLIYQKQNKYDLALEYFLKALKIQEEVKDKKIMATIIDNIGDVYFNKGNYALGREYVEKGLKINEDSKDFFGIVSSLLTLSKITLAQNENDKAEEYTNKALKIATEKKMLLQISQAYNLLYRISKTKGDYAKALEYHELNKQLNDSLFNIEKSKSIANLESKMTLEKKEKEFALLAKDNALNKLAAEKQARELEITKKQAEAEQLLSLARAEKDKRKQDSLYNLAQQAKLEAENLKTKEEKNKLEAEKERLAHLAELEQQKQIRNSFIGLAVTALLIIILVAIGYYQKQKSNSLLAQQNDEITSQNQEIKRQQGEIAEKNDELSQANEELSQQQEELKVLNENLEAQKKEIELTYTQLKNTSDALGKSINYASSIQNIILADIEQLQSFFTDVFILYHPRDVVSGDFYWFSKISDTQSVFVLADCTGHGVPGAFMSMLGSTLLDEIVNEKKLYTSPANILSFLHQRLQKILKQTEGKNTDGMDISIAYFEKKASTTQVRFAGAKSHAYYIMNHQLHNLDGDRTYLGGKQPVVEFTNREIEFITPTIFYFFSDGFTDQNNAERNRFGAKNFQELLFSVHHLSLAEQKVILENQLHTHQGQEPQRDDISVVGLKI